MFLTRSLSSRKGSNKMKFIGRSKQLNQLKREMTSDEMRMSLIYGRRRVGKSELVKQAIRESGIKSIYYECRQMTEESNVQSICEVISEVQNLPKLGYTSFHELMEYVFSLGKK